MWITSETAFFALSPRLYMMTPQPTEQYGQVLRVSVVRASLKARVSASTGCGEKPINARLEPPIPAAQALKNCLRFISIRPPDTPGHERTYARQDGDDIGPRLTYD